MAYLASLLAVPVEILRDEHTRDSILKTAKKCFHCSHFISNHLQIRPILNEGTPLKSKMWHPITKPHYILPVELPPIIESLRIVADDDQIKTDSWTLAEIRKLGEACEYALDHNLALVIILSNTLSQPPLGRKGHGSPDSK